MNKLWRTDAAVAQLDRVFGYEPKGRGFESLQPYQKWKAPKRVPSTFLLALTEFLVREGMD